MHVRASSVAGAEVVDGVRAIYNDMPVVRAVEPRRCSGGFELVQREPAAHSATERLCVSVGDLLGVPVVADSAGQVCGGAAAGRGTHGVRRAVDDAVVPNRRVGSEIAADGLYVVVLQGGRDGAVKQTL